LTLTPTLPLPPHHPDTNIASSFWLVPIHTASSIATDSHIDLAIMSGLESTDKNYTNDTTDGGTTTSNDALLNAFDAMKEQIKALQDEAASQAESATKILQALLAPYEAFQARMTSYKAWQAGLASRKAMLDEFEAALAELTSQFAAMMKTGNPRVEMASLKATKEEYKIFEANANEGMLKKVEVVREAMAHQCKEMHTYCTMRY
jgi:hypothetical protein